LKALVTGAGGFLGRFVVEKLLQRGHKVRAIVRPRSTAPAWPSDVEIFPADLRVGGNLSQAFDGVDAVIHLAAATSGSEDVQFASSVVGTERLLGAMEQTSVRRLVHISSIAVYDWSSIRSVMDEKSPLANNIYEMGAYTIAKVWQERLVTRAASSSRWDLTIMRPGFIWGPGHLKIAGMGRQAGQLYFTFGLGTRLPLSHVLNCADSVVLALETPLNGIHAFNVFDGEDVRVRRYVREYRRRSGKPGWIVPIPYRAGLGLARLAAMTSRAAFGKRGRLPSLLVPRRFESQFKPIRFSNEKLRRELGWVQPYSFQQCLDFTNPEPRGKDGETALSKMGHS
jgi:nucleoside-diphosphate-sugar epimerase